MLADIINGSFEAFGAVFVCLNILTLLRDKQVKGVHWGSTIFFTSWGVWNVFYYPSLGQTMSTIGGALLCAANLAWFGLRLYYARTLQAWYRLWFSTYCQTCCEWHSQAKCRFNRPRRRQWAFFDVD